MEHLIKKVNSIIQEIIDFSPYKKKSFLQFFNSIHPYTISLAKLNKDNVPFICFDVIDPYYGGAEFFNNQKYYYLYHTLHLLNIPYYQIMIDDWNSRTQRYYKEIITGINEDRANFPRLTQIQKLTKDEFYHYAELFSHKNPDKYTDRHHDNYCAVKDIDGNFLFGFCKKEYSNHLYNLIINPDYNGKMLYDLLKQYCPNCFVIIELGLEEHIFRDLISKMKLNEKPILYKLDYRYDYEKLQENQYKILLAKDQNTNVTISNCGFKLYEL